MVSKEKFNKLKDNIFRLNELTESISLKEIYPVSFFSQAFDITNNIQDLLHQLEMAQIELFEKQMKEHQAQIRTIERRTELSETMPLIVEINASEIPLSDLPLVNNLNNDQNISEITIEHQETLNTKNIPVNEREQNIINYSKEQNGKKTLADLKKVFTLNDRFRFCRELFSSDENLMNITISDLNTMESYNESMAYIKNHFHWNWQEDVVNDFIAMLEKRFNN